MQFFIHHQKFTDIFKLTRRAIFGAINCKAVGNLIRYIYFINFRIYIFNGQQLLSFFCTAIDHFINKPLHLLAANIGKAVAKAHVKNGSDSIVIFFAREKLMIQNVDNDPGIEKLIVGLLNIQFDGSFAMMCTLKDADAWFDNVVSRRRGYSFQLDIAGAAQPAAHDILRQLSMRPRSQTNWIVQFLSILFGVQNMIVPMFIKKFLGNVEHFIILVQIVKYYSQQLLKRSRIHQKKVFTRD